MQRIQVSQDFSLPVERVYTYLAEHEHLGTLFGAKITRVKDGHTERNGVGSVRQLKVGPLPPFEETVTEAVTNTKIAYRITKGSPLKDHHGLMEFSTTDTGSRLNYVIEFGSVVPGLDRIIKSGLERNIRKGLQDVESLA